MTANSLLRRPAPKRALAAFTMVEVMVSILVLTVAVFILTSTVTASISHSVVKAQRTLAVEAAMNAIEHIRALPQEDVFALYNTDPSDDPYGPGTGPGNTFTVEGLEAITGGNGQLQPIGEILLPGNGSELIETANQPEFGLPRDLDGNLRIDPEDVKDSYIVLPIIVRIRWRTRLGDREFEMATMLADLAKWTDR